MIYRRIRSKRDDFDRVCVVEASTFERIHITEKWPWVYYLDQQDRLSLRIRRRDVDGKMGQRSVPVARVVLDPAENLQCYANYSPLVLVPGRDLWSFRKPSKKAKRQTFERTQDLLRSHLLLSEQLMENNMWIDTHALEKLLVRLDDPKLEKGRLVYWKN